MEEWRKRQPSLEEQIRIMQEETRKKMEKFGFVFKDGKIDWEKSRKNF